MNDDTVTDLDTFDAPYGRQIVVQEVAYASGMTLLRLRIKEGSRFTIIELDAETAERWGQVMAEWANTQNP